MNNSYYIKINHSIQYTARKSTQTISVNSTAPHRTFQQNNIMVLCPKQIITPVDIEEYIRNSRRIVPNSIDEVVKGARPGVHYLLQKSFYPEPTPTSQNTRQGIVVTDKNINFQPGQKGLLSS